MRRFAILLSVAIAASVLWMPTPASACSIVPATEEEYLARADLVFDGVALSSHDPNADAEVVSSGDPIEWTFIVDRRIKGDAAAQQKVTTARMEPSCGVEFVVGVRYRVFAADEDGVFETSLGMGTRRQAVVPETTTTTKPPAPTTTTTKAPAPTTTTKAPGKRPLARTG